MDQSRQPGEPSLWFQRYTLYKELGPVRTIEEAWRRSPAKGSKGRRPDRRWYDIADRWQWRARATAWDDEQRAIAEREAEAERTRVRQEERDRAEKARQVRLQAEQTGLTLITFELGAKAQLLQSWQQKGSPPDAKPRIESLDLERLLRALSLAAKEQRLDYGEATERTVAMLDPELLAQASDEQLERIMAGEDPLRVLAVQRRQSGE